MKDVIKDRRKAMKHILIADDDPVTTSLIAHSMQAESYAVHYAYDVMQAVMTVARSRVDLAIVDLKMPGGCGTDVIRRMKMSNRTGNIPIIVISASMDLKTRQNAMAMGASICFQKPLDLARLQEAALSLLAGEPIDQTKMLALHQDELCFHGS